MYVIAECSNKLKNKRNFEGVQLEFSELEKSLTITNIKNNINIYNYLLDFYLEEFSNDIKEIEKSINKCKIYFISEIKFKIAKQKLIYKIDDKHDDNYYLIEELKKWEI